MPADLDPMPRKSGNCKKYRCGRRVSVSNQVVVDRSEQDKGDKDVGVLRITQLDIPELLLIETVRHRDERGWFSVTYHRQAYAEAGISVQFCQENHSLSRAVRTVRGL